MYITVRNLTFFVRFMKIFVEIVRNRTFDATFAWIFLNILHFKCHNYSIYA